MNTSVLPARTTRDWLVLVAAALAMVGTLPGRTQGLGLITEPLLADLRIGRVEYAQANLWATLVGSVAAVGVGPWIDRFGSRIVLAAVAGALGVAVCAMSGVTHLGALAVALTLTRALGQSALSVVSIAMVGRWFIGRLEMAMAVYSVLLSVGFMIAFPVVGSLVHANGWRFAWFSVGGAILMVLVPMALLSPHVNPELNPEPNPEPGTDTGFSLSEALFTPAFWIFATGTALYGLVASGIGLFNESILAERGLGARVYYQTLVVTAMTGLAGNFVGGWLAQFVLLNRLMATSLLVLAAGLAALPFIETVPMAMAWAGLMGLGGGLVMVLFFSVWPRVFGTRHLGRIQGFAQAMTVLASAVGPVLLASYVERTGSYSGMFYLLAAVVGLTAAASAAVRLPARSAA